MKTEQDYRVTYEVAKLMKQAGYKEKVTACYLPDGTYLDGMITLNWNELAVFSAPLTAMALYWAKSLGYYNKIGVGKCGLYKDSLNYKDVVGEYSFPTNSTGITDKDFDMAFLTAVCNHIITNKNNK